MNQEAERRTTTMASTEPENKLQELMRIFYNDENWNTGIPNGPRRFDTKIKWIEEMVKTYSEKLGIPVNQMVEKMEAARDFSWPNYYQEANFPDIGDDNIIGIFNNDEEFQDFCKANYKGFQCPACKNISWDPQECEHRVKKDGICDWTSMGLFGTGYFVIIQKHRVRPISIFPPVLKEVK